MIEATDTHHRMDRTRWLVVGVLLIAMFMEMVDATIVTIVLPQLQADLSTSSSAMQWAVGGYVLAFGITLITGGRLGDIYGRKRVFVLGIAGFTLASAVCGAAENAQMLILGRLLQGGAAGIMVPQVMSLIVVLFAPAERTRVFVFYGLTLSLANVSGPILGAIITELDLLELGWRMIFFVNLPLGLAAAGLSLRLLPESRADAPLRPDFVGMALISLVALAIAYPLIQGREQGWPSWMFMLMFAALPLLVAFVWQQRVRERAVGSALVPLSLFRQRSFVAGLFVMLVLFSGLASLFFVLTYALQVGSGWPVITTAAAFASWPIGIALTSGFAQHYACQHGRKVITIGLAIMAAGASWLIGTIMVPDFWFVVPPIFVIGMGMGLCVPILSSVALSDVPPENAGAASGVLNAVLQMGTAMGIALVGTVYFGLVGPAVGDAPAPASPEQAFWLGAAATSLRYNAVAFIVCVVLARILPDGASRQRQPS